MKIFTSFKSIFLLIAVSATLACNGVPSAMSTPPGNAQPAVTKISSADWQQLLNDNRSATQKVAWRVKITDVSYFGGFYVKGHLLESKSARVHLIWPPEATPSATTRKNLVEGMIVTISGSFEGVTTEREAIISVSNCAP